MTPDEAEKARQEWLKQGKFTQIDFPTVNEAWHAAWQAGQARQRERDAEKAHAKCVLANFHAQPCHKCKACEIAASIRSAQ